jgi:hypothetical protein
LLEAGFFKIIGEMAERSKAHAWKVCIRQRIEGSNPSLSATYFINLNDMNDQAIAWLTKAADQNNEAAQNNLVRIYENGLGVIRDAVKADPTNLVSYQSQKNMFWTMTGSTLSQRKAKPPLAASENKIEPTDRHFKRK